MRPLGSRPASTRLPQGFVATAVPSALPPSMANSISARAVPNFENRRLGYIALDSVGSPIAPSRLHYLVLVRSFAAHDPHSALSFPSPLPSLLPHCLPLAYSFFPFSLKL